jgi:hypothetical protein
MSKNKDQKVSGELLEKQRKAIADAMSIAIMQGLTPAEFLEKVEMAPFELREFIKGYKLLSITSISKIAFALGHDFDAVFKERNSEEILHENSN